MADTETDRKIVRLNSVGLGLSHIGDKLAIHKSTVKARLNALGIAPADTRRTFMQDVFETLPTKFQDRLMDHLGGGMPIGAFVRKLIIDYFIAQDAQNSKGQTD